MPVPDPNVHKVSPATSRATKLQQLDEKPQLWVVEDDPDDCMLLSDAIEESGIECDLAFFEDGTTYLKFLQNLTDHGQQGSPAITLMDINMPRMDGISTLSSMRADPRFKHLPVLMFTTSDSQEDIQQTYLLGINAYLTKPNSQSGMQQVIEFVSHFWSSPKGMSSLAP